MNHLQIMCLHHLGSRAKPWLICIHVVGPKAIKVEARRINDYDVGGEVMCEGCRASLDARMICLACEPCVLEHWGISKALVS